MKLQQLACVLEIVKQGFHISAAARELYTSQPGVSRQLQQLESELGFPIFVRTRNHIEGLTEPGETVVDVARRIMADVDTLRSLKEDMLNSDQGTLTIATTHTQANYILPDVIGPFVKTYPGVQVSLIQGDPESICQMVEENDADLALGTETASDHPHLVDLPCFALDRIVIVPEKHPLLDIGRIGLQDMVRYPIITYDHRFSGYWKVIKAFEEAGLQPNIVLSAIDAGVCKTYVAKELGIAILTAITFDEERDQGLRAIPADHLFASSMNYVKLRQNTYLRPYILDFIHRLSPHLKPAYVRDMMARRSLPTGRERSKWQGGTRRTGNR